jgi:hypothetical protein
VLGMHRSGTSAMMRMLGELGIPSCIQADLIPGLAGNPRGHYESATLLRINSELIESVGRTWWCPPEIGTLVPGDDADAKARARDAFMSVHPTLRWACKDPRSCVTMPFWFAVLDDPPPIIVAISRNPLEVAASLHKRDHFSKRLGLAMWERYARSMLTYMDGQRVFLTDYDDLVTQPAQWCENAVAFFHSLGIPLEVESLTALTQTLEPGLRHSRYGVEDLVNDPDVSENQVAIYNALRASAGAAAAFQSPRLPEEDPGVEKRFRRTLRIDRRAARRLELLVWRRMRRTSSAPKSE